LVLIKILAPVALCGICFVTLQEVEERKERETKYEREKIYKGKGGGGYWH
jgi:hypothetical protein